MDLSRLVVPFAIACTSADPPAAQGLPAPELEAVLEAPASPPVVVVPDEKKTIEPAPKPVVATPEPEPVPAPPWVQASAVAGENWLLWSVSDGEPSTQWIVTSTKAPRIAGERADIVVADGDRMWRLEHARVEAPMYACDCYDPDSGRRLAGCEPTERVDRPSLRAVDLATQTATPIVDASGDLVAGNEAFFDLEIAGGVGAKLFVATYEEGYFCGAHPIDERSFEIFDVAAGARREGVLDEVLAGLPERVLREGRAATRAEIEDCFHDDEPLDEALAEPLVLAAVTVRLELGRPIVTWELERGLPHACATDDAAHGPVETRLIPEAAALGLTGPLPPAVAAALREIGDADAVGWSRIEVEGEAARIALARFRGEDPEPTDAADAPVP